MDPFSYIIVLTSIILGLSVTRTVGGVGHLLQTRKRRPPFWIHSLWLLNLLVLVALMWFIAYRWRANEHWTFFLFVWLLITPTILYLISSLLFPEQDDAEPISNWETYFFDHHREIFLLFAALFPIDLIDTALKGWQHLRDQGPVYPVTMLVWLVLCLIAAFTKNKAFHGCFAVVFMMWNLAFAGMMLITAQDAPGAGWLRTH